MIRHPQNSTLFPSTTLFRSKPYFYLSFHETPLGVALSRTRHGRVQPATSFAATARANKSYARGVLRISIFILANGRALSGLAPAASQNSAAWSAKASG